MIYNKKGGKIKSKSFTLIEILIVIAIIGILAGMIILALNNAKNKAREAVVQSSLRSVVPVANMCRENGNIINGDGQTNGEINTALSVVTL